MPKRKQPNGRAQFTGALAEPLELAWLTTETALVQGGSWHY